MATPIATGDTATTALLALGSLEEQFTFIGQQLAARQNLYNAANPTAVKNVITLTPDFANNRITLSSVLPLDANAVTSFSASAVAPILTGV
jgi:hypothetical protein